MKIARLIVCVSITLWLLLVSQYSHGRHAAILIDSSNGNVLYELEANQSWYPASLTKMMTLYMTFQALESGHLRLNRHLNVSSHAAHQPTSKLGLKPWESISVEDAIIAIITRSANDAAVVLAEGVAGSERQFAVKMTTTAHRLGMYGSHFMNATGLPHDWQTTTAHDMGLLAMRIIRDFPRYYSYFGVDSMYFNGRELRSINKFVNYYPGAEGMKTGYTCGSGYNLVASANQYGKRLIGVVLGGMTSSERYEHMFMMMDMGFSNPYGTYRSKNINTMSRMPVGTPPYQLSCGHRPSSHYAFRNHEEDDDDHNIHYVKKYRESTLFSEPKKLALKSKNDEPKPRVVYKEPKKYEPVHALRAERKPALHAGKSHDREIHLAKMARPAAISKEKSSKSTKRMGKIASVKAKTAGKPEKAQKPLKIASREKAKGYFVPSAKSKKAAVASSKNKSYFKPDSKPAKTLAKAPAKAKKSKKKS